MDSRKPLVSVIVLTYNHENYVSQALDSILRQVVKFDYEILVGDDASTDATVPILLKYKKKYPDIIKLFLNKENVGATRNAYNLLMKAKGEYLATCEGDDYWTDNNKLQIQVDFLENNMDFIGCSHEFTIVDKVGKKRRNQVLPWVKNKNDVFTINDFQGIFLPGQPSTFVRRNIINELDLNNLFTAHNMIGDRTLMLMYLMHGSFAILHKNMSCYRINDSSITRTIYSDGGSHVLTDYEITLKLERIASLNHFELDTTIFKRILFAKAFLYCCLTQKLEYLKLCQTIFKKNNQKIRLFLEVPHLLIILLWRRI